MITLRGQILVSRIGDDPPPSPCVHPKRFPCLRSKRFRVYWHQAHMFPTCGLGARTHGDVLNLHTESVLNVCTVFLPQRHTPHHTTRRQKQRDRERETRQDKRRRDKTRRQEKRREEMKKKREEEERRRREKKKEKMNRDKQFFRECPSAPELFSHQIPENVLDPPELA